MPDMEFIIAFLVSVLVVLLIKAILTLPGDPVAPMISPAVPPTVAPAVPPPVAPTVAPTVPPTALPTTLRFEDLCAEVQQEIIKQVFSPPYPWPSVDNPQDWQSLQTIRGNSVAIPAQRLLVRAFPNAAVVYVDRRKPLHNLMLTCRKLTGICEYYLDHEKKKVQEDRTLVMDLWATLDEATNEPRVYVTYLSAPPCLLEAPNTTPTLDLWRIRVRIDTEAVQYPNQFRRILATLDLFFNRLVFEDLNSLHNNQQLPQLQSEGWMEPDPAIHIPGRGSIGRVNVLHLITIFHRSDEVLHVRRFIVDYQNDANLVAARRRLIPPSELAVRHLPEWRVIQNRHRRPRKEVKLHPLHFIKVYQLAGYALLVPTLLFVLLWILPNL